MKCNFSKFSCSKSLMNFDINEYFGTDGYGKSNLSTFKLGHWSNRRYFKIFSVRYFEFKHNSFAFIPPKFKDKNVNFRDHLQTSKRSLQYFSTSSSDNVFGKDLVPLYHDLMSTWIFLMRNWSWVRFRNFLETCAMFLEFPVTWIYRWRWSCCCWWRQTLEAKLHGEVIYTSLSNLAETICAATFKCRVKTPYTGQALIYLLHQDTAFQAWSHSILGNSPRSNRARVRRLDCQLQGSTHQAESCSATRVGICSRCSSTWIWQPLAHLSPENGEKLE